MYMTIGKNGLVLKFVLHSIVQVFTNQILFKKSLYSKFNTNTCYNKNYFIQFFLIIKRLSVGKLRFLIVKARFCSKTLCVCVCKILLNINIDFRVASNLNFSAVIDIHVTTWSGIKNGFQILFPMKRHALLLMIYT